MATETDSPRKDRYPGPRWIHVTPDWLVAGLLVVECLFWLSDRHGWPAWHKGYAVLASVAAVGMALAAMFLWFLVALAFRLQFQFGLRSLLVLAVVVALPCSWLAVEMKNARRQCEAAVAIKICRGDYYYNMRLDPSDNFILDPEPSEPTWLRTLLGFDFFDDVTMVFVRSTDATDADLGTLKYLRQLQVLGLTGNRLTDSALVNLQGLERLEKLYLDYNQITGAGLGALTDLKRLKALSLSGNTINDAGLENLKGLNRLQELFLCNTQITDAGLEKIKSLGKLKRLQIIGTNVTDAGLEHLNELSQLKELFVWHTAVTDEGVKRLQQALPNCDIKN